jgi:hypothetical protein
MPRSVLEPGAARRGGGARPGEIKNPDEAVSGGAFGRPGPDTGWVLRLVKQTEFDRSDSATEAVVASVAAARASYNGRGPAPADVEVALMLLGLRPDGLSEEVVTQLGAARAKWLSKASHERVKGRSFLDQLSPGMLGADPDRVRHLLNVAGLTAAT